MSLETPLRPTSVAKLGLVKMDDRKRAADHDDSHAPPAKRPNVTTTNGEKANEGVMFGPSNSPWQVDLNVCAFGFSSL